MNSSARRWLNWGFATIVILGVALFAFGRLYGSPAVASGCPAGTMDCEDVLFIGNSYTYVNDLPSVFSQLAASGGRPVSVGMLAFSNATLKEHLDSPDFRQTLRDDRWDRAVVQEQSLVPMSVDPAASNVDELVAELREAAVEPVLMITPARNESWNSDLYLAKQTGVNAWYRSVSKQAEVDVAPSGVAWSKAVSKIGPEYLWAEDGTHPSTAGTYLQACVIYATLFNASPVGLSFSSDLSPELALEIQKISNSVVRGRDRVGA